MHRVVLYSRPIVSNGETLYGRLWGGFTEKEIMFQAKLDYKILYVRESFEGIEGDLFRQRENWIPFTNEDGSGWWNYDEDKYSFDLGFDPIPDQFVEHCKLPNVYVAILSNWVLLKIADTNNDGYIVNETFYDLIIGGNPNDLQWMSILPEEDDILS